MQTSPHLECELVFSEGRATCLRCGRSYSAPHGRLRAICTPKSVPPPAQSHLPSGPGTELKALLATIGIVASPTCKCNKMAKQMDQWGQESLNHIEEIVDVMEETAKKRKLPFLRPAGRTLVRIACWKAKRKGNR